MSVKASRRDCRRWGKRKTAREARKNALRILELYGEGVSPAAIASSVGVAKADVLEVLDIAEKLGAFAEEEASA